jgi:transglutaminase-like putative cysteine protease
VRIRSLPLTIPAALGAALGVAAPRAGADREPARRFELIVEVSVPAAPGARVRLWCPMPQSGSAQDAVLARIAWPWPHRIETDPEFGTRILYAEGLGAATAVTGRAAWRVSRRVQRGGNGGTEEAPPEPAALYLEPRGLVRVTDKIRAIARDRTRGRDDIEDRARALYAYVLDRMTYDKSGEGWGRGDSVYACDVAKGNCTDFHSLFMALSMAAAVPTRFHMGFLVPPRPSGELSGYHCWAEYYHPLHGWTPVDISEAWKHRDRAGFYFGSLDPDRVLLSTGREVRLAPPPDAAGRLNWFFDPYAEADGRPLPGVRATWRFRDFEYEGGGS